MVNGSGGKDTMERLDILNRSNDGFYIASEDLKLRGPGDIFGVRQSGDLEFRIGCLLYTSECENESQRCSHYPEWCY